MQKRTVDILLVLIFAIALFVRVINPQFGTPVLYVNPDEVPNYLSALNMLSQKTLTTTSQYPPLGSYIMLPFLGLAYLIMRISHIFPDLISFNFYLLSHEGFLMFVPRLIYSFLGFLNLIIIYRVCLRIFPKSKSAALLAVLTLTFSIAHLQISHSSKPWTGAILFFLLSINEILGYYKSKRFREFILANIYAAMGIGFHFSAVFVLPVIWLFSYKYFLGLHKWNDKLKYLIIGSLPIIAFFVFKSSVPYPYESELSSYLKYNLEGRVLDNVLFYIRELFFTEFGLVVTFLLSLKLIKKWPKQLKLIFVFCVFYFIFISIFWAQSIRFLLPIIVLLPVLTVPAFHFLISKLHKINIRLIFSAWIMILILPGLYWLLTFLKTPTFIESMLWTNKELSPEIPIASNSIRFSPFVPDKKAIFIMRKTQPKIYHQLNKLLPDSEYPDNVRNIYYLEKIADFKNPEEINEFLISNQISYVFQYYWDPEQRWVNIYPYHFTLIKRFSPSFKDNVPVDNLLHVRGNFLKLLDIYRFGPYIDILKINPKE